MVYMKTFVDHSISQKSNEPARIEAYQWLLGVFDGNAVWAMVVLLL